MKYMKVMIVGAGIGGLALAARLKREVSINIAIYERDETAFSRSQGYALGLKGDSGLPALDELGLRDEILGADALKVTNFVFTDQKGNELLALPNRDDRHVTYRVQRDHLKQVLLRAAGLEVSFGKTCIGYEKTNQGVRVAFSDGSHEVADYVIGADGVASAIRQQMIGGEKHYLGLSAIVGLSPIDVDDPLLDGGYFMTLGDNGSSMFVYRQPGGVHFSYTTSVLTEEELASLAKSELLAKVKTGTRGWHQLVQKIVDTAEEDSLLVRGYYDKEPVGQVHDGNIWLLGDAAHPMCPFQGQGANMALVDALKIGDFLAREAKGEATDAVLLEQDIVKRGRKAVLESRNAAKQFHTANGLMRFNRNLGFRIANVMIRLFSKKKSTTN